MSDKVYFLGVDAASPNGDKSAMALFVYENGGCRIIACEERLGKFRIWWTVLKWRIQKIVKDMIGKKK